MATSVKPITILGAGQIGFAIAVLLKQAGGYDILVADRDAQRLKALAALGLEVMALDDDSSLVGAVSGRYAVLNALPFHRAIPVAGICAKERVHYFDLTEDVSSTQALSLIHI